MDGKKPVWIRTSFQYSVWMFVLIALVYLLGKMDVFEPVMTAFWRLFYPVLITGFLFYIFRPIVQVLSGKTGLPLSVSILVVFSMAGAVGYGGFRLLLSKFSFGVSSLSGFLSHLKEMSHQVEAALSRNDLGPFSFLSDIEVSKYYDDLTQRISDHLGMVFSTMIDWAAALFVIPVVLFFFLKDGNQFVPFVLRIFPDKWAEGLLDLMRKMDKTLGAYVLGQMIVAFIDGSLMYFSYLIIGMDYALLLGLFLMITSIIPFFGPLIGVVPAVALGFMQSPMVVIQILVALLIVQQLEGNLVAPYVLGERLGIHPVTIIFLLLAAMPLAGLVGMIIAVPVYAVGKVLIKELSQRLMTS
ncbi:AI-2E family transporter [Halobacillus trueperi]|uniref:AI-2E family transporter n=1 Tax=Halobacillus trueperi TaxID=156205 RepID=UPI003735FD4E